MLKIPSPHILRKYGLYAMLSFFISLSAVLGLDDLRVREADVKYERMQNEKLRQALDEQYKLKTEQELLLQMTKETPDTLKYRHEGH